MPDATLKNAVDTWVNNGTTAEKARHYFTTTKMGIRSGLAHPFLFFNRPFPLGATILEARLGLYTTTAWNLTTTVNAYPVEEPWKVSKINWNNHLALDLGTAIPSTHTGLSNTVNDLFEFDLQPLLQTVSDGAAWNGVMLSMTAANLGKAFWSSQAASHKPYLYVRWAVVPAVPSRLSPGGGRAVSITKPTLRFDFTDSQGGGGLAAVNVQISTSSSSFASPAFDSGWVPTTSPSLDLTTTAYGGTAPGSTKYWRARVRNVAGLESDWSDATTFTRTAKGSVAIVNPAADPNDFVTEPTPPIIWAHTPAASEVQEAFEVEIVDTLSGARVHTSEYKTSTEVSYTLPLGVLNPARTYRADVTVYDDVDRESTPGDPTGMKASREFTVGFDSGVAGVDNLTAYTYQNRVVLEWNRSTAPDAYVVTADGVPVVADLDPADVLTTGTSYRYEVSSARPRTWTTWDVVAVVNGGQSEPGPGIPEQLVTNGVWLTDVERDLSLWIASDGNGTWSMGEDGETFFGLGSTKPVRLTQAVRGWEDVVEGFLIGTETKSMLEWYDLALDFRSRPGRTYVMQVGNEAFECIIHDVQVPPTGGTAPTKRKIVVGFEMTSDPRFPVVL